MADHKLSQQRRTRKTYPPIVTGSRFARLTVIADAPPYNHPTHGAVVKRWWLRCDCGKEVIRHQSQLNSGQSRDCGCGRRFQTIPIGTVIGSLTVIDDARLFGRQWKVPCRCSCGTETLPFSFSLTEGKTKTCGSCQKVCSPANKRAVAAATTKHGWSGTSEYSAWLAMRKRCNDPNNKAYRNYGARGIKVCAEWQDDFEAFLAHVGPKPSPDLSIDRIDNDKGYEPGNVRWADRSTQSRNRRPFIIRPRGVAA